MDQDICKNAAICESYRDINYKYINAKICLTNSFQSQFCCGSCYNRYCCNDESASLNQTNCVPLTTQFTPLDNLKKPNSNNNNKKEDKSLVYSLM